MQRLSVKQVIAKLSDYDSSLYLKQLINQSLSLDLSQRYIHMYSQNLLINRFCRKFSCKDVTMIKYVKGASFDTERFNGWLERKKMDKYKITEDSVQNVRTILNYGKKLMKQGHDFEMYVLNILKKEMKGCVIYENAYLVCKYENKTITYEVDYIITQNGKLIKIIEAKSSIGDIRSGISQLNKRKDCLQNAKAHVLDKNKRFLFQLQEPLFDKFYVITQFKGTEHNYDNRLYHTFLDKYFRLIARNNIYGNVDLKTFIDKWKGKLEENLVSDALNTHKVIVLG